VLGSMLNGGAAAIEEARTLLTEDSFYVPAHQLVFASILTMHQGGTPTDLITVTSALRDLGRLDEVGGASYVTSLFTCVPTAANMQFYVEIVRGKYVLRKIIAGCTESIRRAYEEQDDIKALLDDTLATLTALAHDAYSQSSLRHIADGVMESLNRLEVAFENKGEAVVTGLSTGFFDIDRSLAGLKGGQFLVIAARPSHGKTALAMNIAEHVAVQLHAPVAVFSLEMSYQELIDRMVCSHAGVSLQRLRDGFMKHSDFNALPGTVETLRSAPVYIDDTPQLSLYDFKARARRAVLKHGARLLVIDYLQLMRSPSRRAQENRALEITEISGALKATAKELNVPVIALAQLNREAEGRPLGAPQLSDLRESGSIEQDADIVMLLTRPVRHCKDDGAKQRAAERLGLDDASDLETLAILDIAKHRNGPVGPMRLNFNDSLTRFTNTTAAMWSNDESKRQKHD